MSEARNHGPVRSEESHLADEELAALIDDRLPTDRRAAAEAHLARCRECLGEYLELKRTAGQEAPVPAEFLERAGVRPPRLPMPPRLMLRAAALLLAAGALAYLFHLNRPLGLRREPPVAGGPPAPQRAPAAGPEAGKKGTADGERPKVVFAAEEKSAAPASAPAPAATAPGYAPVVGGVRAGAQDETAGAEAEERLETGPPVPDDALRTRETAAAAPVDGRLARQQKTLQGEPRRAETHGPAQAANQANVNVIRPAASPPPPLYRAELTGELTVADIRNPGVLARLSALAIEAEVELVVDAAGRVTRVAFPLPPPRADRRALRALLFKLEFAPVRQEERRGRLRIRGPAAG